MCFNTFQKACTVCIHEQTDIIIMLSLGSIEVDLVCYKRNCYNVTYKIQYSKIINLRAMTCILRYVIIRFKCTCTNFKENAKTEL